ncbi:hypothetical protein Tco_1214094 [Tanacetum coccineum]
MPIGKLQFKKKEREKDLGNEVRSSVEQGTTAMEKLVEKLGNAEEKAECKKLKKELEKARFSNTFLRDIPIPSQQRHTCILLQSTSDPVPFALSRHQDNRQPSSSRLTRQACPSCDRTIRLVSSLIGGEVCAFFQLELEINYVLRRKPLTIVSQMMEIDRQGQRQTALNLSVGRRQAYISARSSFFEELGKRCLLTDHPEVLDEVFEEEVVIETTQKHQRLLNFQRDLLVVNEDWSIQVNVLSGHILL